MSKKLIIIVILLSILGIYLNRSYSRIYDRVEPSIFNISWMDPVTLKNSNFQNTVKYVALGDSLSVGVGSNDQTKTLPYIVAGKISEQMSVTLINLAISGATTQDVIVDQLDKAASQKPNYITLLIGTNDIHSLISPSKFEAQMSYIINFLTKNTSAKIIIFNIPYLGSENLILFPYNFILNYQVQRYNNVLTNLSKTNQITLIDLYTPTKESFSKQANFYSSDNFHPSEEGYLMWGSLVTLKEL